MVSFFVLVDICYYITYKATNARIANIWYMQLSNYYIMY